MMEVPEPGFARASLDFLVPLAPTSVRVELTEDATTEETEMASARAIPDILALHAHRLALALQVYVMMEVLATEVVCVPQELMDPHACHAHALGLM